MPVRVVGLVNAEELQDAVGNANWYPVTVFSRLSTMTHPENSPEVNELMEEIAKSDVCDVWCKGCQDWRKANAAYAKYLQGEIESCGRCRGK